MAIKYYYLAAKNEIYRDDLHGPREIMIDDPIFDKKKAAKGVVAMKVAAPNPKTKLPPEAVEITQEKYAEVMDGHRKGQDIVAGPDGQPMLADRPGPTPEQIVASVRAERNALLTASDWTQMPDAPLDAMAKANWAHYRKALRDVDFTVADPSKIVLPKAPN